MLALLIQLNKQNPFGQQIFIWRKILYQINEKNEKNTIDLAKIYHQKNEWLKILKVLENIPKDSLF